MSGEMMTNETEERLSALIDSELSSALTADMLARVKQSPELRGTWDRYHLIGDAIRGECVRSSSGGIAEAVRKQVINEPAIIAQPTPINSSTPRDRLLRPLAGAAIAASVAGLAVFALPRLTNDVPEPVPVQISSQTPPAPVYYSNQSGTRWKNLKEPALESKLNRYLENHSEYASAGGMGVLPYSSFVSYDTTRTRP